LYPEVLQKFDGQRRGFLVDFLRQPAMTGVEALLFIH
jgi:hypothetical protein